MNDLAVQIAAPIGRDAELLARFLNDADIATEIVGGRLDSLTPEERDRTGVLLLAEEVLTPENIALLSALLADQPTWSELPVLLLVSGGRETSAHRTRQHDWLPLGYVITLERPLRPSSLLSAVQAALRSRKRQYEVRRNTAELAEAYAALRQSEQQSRIILQSTHDCIKLLDLEGNLLSVNDEGQKRLGIDDFATVCGTPWPAFWRGADAIAARSAIASALAGRAGRFEGFFELPSGEPTWWDISVTPVRDDSDTVVNLLAVSREITDRKRTEQALIQSEKLAAVGKLVSTISHEINNPLESVTNLIYIAMHSENLPQETYDVLASADDELRRAGQIVAQTLRFHRQSTRPRRTTPEEIVSSVTALYRGRLMNSHIATETRHAPDTTFVCFEGEIRQVLSNLIGNAIDAMRNGGKLSVRSHRAMDYRTGRHGIAILVADTGQGMDPEVARRIFEAFYSTKGDNGTGLGLWITKGIVEKHRGTLSVRTRQSDRAHVGGTVFRLFLPDLTLIPAQEA